MCNMVAGIVNWQTYIGQCKDFEESGDDNVLGHPDPAWLAGSVQDDASNKDFWAAMFT